MPTYFIGIDLAWGEKNASGFCVLQKSEGHLEIVELQLLYSIEEIFQAVKKYQNSTLYVGVDAPLIVPNREGNRAIEKAFNKDFAPYKIAMLPVNRNIMTQYTDIIRSETLYTLLNTLTFTQGKLTLFEVYPHATIAVCFHNNKILPYKRKKGRNSTFIREQLLIYRSFLEAVIESHTIFSENIELLKGKNLKHYEDKLDAITSAYTLYYTQNNPHKIYKLEDKELFITPI